MAKEGPTTSLLHLFNSGNEEDFPMSDPKPEAEQEGSSSSPITVAEVCMAETPPPQTSPARDGADRTNEATWNNDEIPLRGGWLVSGRRTSAFRRLELG